MEITTEIHKVTYSSIMQFEKERNEIEIRQSKMFGRDFFFCFFFCTCSEMRVLQMTLVHEPLSLHLKLCTRVTEGIFSKQKNFNFGYFTRAGAHHLNVKQ